MTQRGLCNTLIHDPALRASSRRPCGLRRAHPGVRRSLLIGLLLAGAATAAAAEVEIYLEPERAYLGQPVRLVLTLSNFRTAEEPAAPTLSGAILLPPAGAAEQSSTVYDGITGRTTRRVARTYQYTLVPERVGTLEIPPFTVQVDGELRTTTPLHLIVLPHDLGEVLRATITLAEQRIYVGQRVRATLTIWIKAPRWGNQVLSIDAVRERLRAGALDPFPARVQERRTGTPPGVPGDQLWYAFELATDLRPDRPGPLLFDNIVVGVDYPTNRGTWNLLTRPEAPAIDVLPIPMDERPPHFSGAVGIYSIETRAHPTSVRVGDPIRLTVEIFGDGELDTLPPPLLEADSALTRLFRLPSEPLAGEVVNGRRRYQITLRPLAADAREIPALEYPYFDPLAGRFVVARSKPIPLAVEPVETVTLPDLAPLTRTATPELAGRDGLRDIETAEHRLLARAFRPAPTLIVLATLAPPALFTLAWVGVRLQRRTTGESQKLRGRRAYRAARLRLVTLPTDPPTAVAHTITLVLAHYLAERLGAPPGRVTGMSALEVLQQRGAHPELLTRWQVLLATCEQAAFAGSAFDAEALRREALAVLVTTEGQRW